MVVIISTNIIIVVATISLIIINVSTEIRIANIVSIVKGTRNNIITVFIIIDATVNIASASAVIVHLITHTITIVAVVVAVVD